MTFIARVYSVMVGGPSDVQDDVDVAISVIDNWSRINARRQRKVLLPLYWRTNTYPCVGKNPQKAINEQMTDYSDLLICIFGTKLGSPTDTHPSGSIEEIEEHIKNGRHVMVFFHCGMDTRNINVEQFTKLQQFKEAHSHEVYWGDFKDSTEFKSILAEKLQLFLNDTWLNPDYNPVQINHNLTEIKLNKSKIEVYHNATDYVSIENVDELDFRCNLSDDKIAWATREKNKIEITGKKVGKTTLTVSSGEIKSECEITVLPMCDFCGSPILDFGIDKNSIKTLLDVPITETPKLIHKRNGNIDYWYQFSNGELELVGTRIKRSSTPYYSYYLEALNSMTERYDSVSSGGNVHWYQYKNLFFIASFENKQKDWYFIYSPNKELISKDVKQIIGY